jgi:hypothetical protein
VVDKRPEIVAIGLACFSAAVFGIRFDLGLLLDRGRSNDLDHEEGQT